MADAELFQASTCHHGTVAGIRWFRQLREEPGELERTREQLVDMMLWFADERGIFCFGALRSRSRGDCAILESMPRLLTAPLK